jgi:hypothetical protein
MDRNNTIIEAKGVGLGLSTARALLMSLGGKIEIATSKGEGTKVMFSMFVENKPVIRNVTLKDLTELERGKEIIHDLKKSNMRLSDFNGTLIQHKNAHTMTQ